MMNELFNDQEEDFIWLAGWTDGEGTFSIAKVKRKWLTRHVYQGQLKWTSTDIELMQALHDWLGGSLGYRKPPKPNQKPFAVLILAQRQAEPVIEEMLPHLRTKYQHAKLFLHYMTKVRLRGAQAYRGRTEEDWEELDKIYMVMKNLNQRGI